MAGAKQNYRDRQKNLNKGTPEQNARKEELKARRKEIADEVSKLIDENMDADGGIDGKALEDYQRLSKERDEIEYELYNMMGPLSDEKYAKYADKRMTALDASENAIARNDLLKNKEYYMAVAEAEHGVYIDQNTAVDNILDGPGGQKMYNAFKKTREMLRKKYGDTITLYRAGTEQKAKSTINMTTLKKNAEQYGQEYGSKVKAVKVPIEHVLLVNVSRTGGYEEVLVLNKGKERFIKKK